MENRVHKRKAAKCHTVSRSTEAKMNSSKKTLKVVILGDSGYVLAFIIETLLL